MQRQALQRNRFYAYAVSALLLGLVALPLTPFQSADSFPISTFPMFSGARTSPMADIPHAIGIDSDGNRHVLPPAALGTGEVVQAFETLRQAIREGEADRLCAEVAASDAARGYTTVLIATDRYDAVAYFADSAQPTTSTEHATCPVAP